MNSQITVLRGSLGALNPTTGLVGGLSGALTIYAGMARIRTVSGSGVLSTGGGTIDTRQTIISIPMVAAIPYRDDIVTVSEVNQDPDGSQADTDLITRAWRVLDVDGGGYFGDARRMTCTQFFDSRYWTGMQ